MTYVLFLGLYLHLCLLLGLSIWSEEGIVSHLLVGEFPMSSGGGYRGINSDWFVPKFQGGLPFIWVLFIQWHKGFISFQVKSLVILESILNSNRFGLLEVLELRFDRFGGFMVQ